MSQEIQVVSVTANPAPGPVASGASLIFTITFFNNKPFAQAPYFSWLQATIVDQTGQETLTPAIQVPNQTVGTVISRPVTIDSQHLTWQVRVPAADYNNVFTYTLTPVAISVAEKGNGRWEVRSAQSMPGIRVYGDLALPARGYATIQDALTIAQSLGQQRELTAEQKEAGDLLALGGLVIQDAMFIAQWVASPQQVVEEANDSSSPRLGAFLRRINRPIVPPPAQSPPVGPTPVPITTPPPGGNMPNRPSGQILSVKVTPPGNAAGKDLFPNIPSGAQTAPAVVSGTMSIVATVKNAGDSYGFYRIKVESYDQRGQPRDSSQGEEIYINPDETKELSWTGWGTVGYSHRVQVLEFAAMKWYTHFTLGDVPAPSPAPAPSPIVPIPPVAPNPKPSPVQPPPPGNEAKTAAGAGLAGLAVVLVLVAAALSWSRSKNKRLV